MKLQRREFINFSAMAAATGILSGLVSCNAEKSPKTKKLVVDNLVSLTTDVVAISTAERMARVEKAQQLMIAGKIAALVLDAGTSMQYFTGISWWPSERAMVAVIPAKGDVTYVCPGFEESRLRELIKIGKAVYTWQEDESPYEKIAFAFKSSGIASGTIGIEEKLRFFILDGMRKQAPHLNYASGDSVVVPCRLIKSPAEIALMQKANDITMAAMICGIAGLWEGMSPGDFSDIVTSAHQKLGAEPDFAMANFGPATAFPHGSVQSQQLKKGNIVLMDCGCSVEGYKSDISRTIFFDAEPTKRQMKIWNLEKKAQEAGFAAARLGATCESVDAASRKVLTDAGFGPGYQLPGLPHRTGHGIGMDGHEWGNIVKGNQQLLQPGMCFSIEPNISIPGEFGVRHEDCVYMTAAGPKWFSEPCPSFHQPFG